MQKIEHLKQRIETGAVAVRHIDDVSVGISNRELKRGREAALTPDLAYDCISNRELKRDPPQRPTAVACLCISNRELKLRLVYIDDEVMWPASQTEN